MNNICVFHVAFLNDYKSILDEMMPYLKNIRKQGFEVCITTCGEGEYNFPFPYVNLGNHPVNEFERPAMKFINSIRSAADRVIYLHTKGVSSHRHGWRRAMLHHLFGDTIRFNINNLNKYDTVGCNWRCKPNPHYSGNFWMATGEYLRSLIDFNEFHCKKGKRFDCELWIGCLRDTSFHDPCTATNIAENKTKSIHLPNNPNAYSLIGNNLHYTKWSEAKWKSIIKTNGIISIAFGEPYIKLAKLTTTYSRQYTDLNWTILTNSKEEWGNFNFIYLDLDDNDNRLVKTNLINYTPYDVSIYFDVDALLQKEGIEDALNINKLGLQRNARGPFGGKLKSFWDTHYLPVLGNKSIQIYNGNFFSFTRKAKPFFDLWHSKWKEFPGRDMPPMAWAASQYKEFDLIKFLSESKNKDAIIQHRYKDWEKDFPITKHKINTFNKTFRTQFSPVPRKKFKLCF